MVFVKYLHELYSGDGLAIKEQQNIVHFKNLGQRESYLLHKNKRSVTLNLLP